MRAKLAVAAIAVLELTMSLFPSQAQATIVSVPELKLTDTGLGEFAMIGGATKDDTLLWRSAAIGGTNNEFRIWSLESDSYFAMTYGVDDTKGLVVVFCGWTYGTNGAAYDTESGLSLWVNTERHDDSKFKPVQGEFADVYESFRFFFNDGQAANKKLKMTHTAEGKANHPFEYFG